MLKEIRDLLDLKAIRDLKDPRAILVNPSQLLLLCHLRVSMVVNETGVASFLCEVKGNPAPQVTWLKQNSSLLVDKRIVPSHGGLMITDVTSQDGGMYTCVAKNILGDMTSSATLTVQGKISSIFFETVGLALPDIYINNSQLYQLI